MRIWILDEAEGGGGRPPQALARLADRLREAFAASCAVSGVRGLVLATGFRHLSPRPIHPRANPQAQLEFRRNFKQLAATALPGETDAAAVDIRFEDEARIGQKGMLARVWAPKGARPRIPRDCRCGYCHLFSSVRPATGASAGHVCERASTVEMNRCPADLSAAVPGGRHAPVVPDGVGWHRSKDLEIPASASLPGLPPHSPELNPAERFFSFPESRHFASRVFETAREVAEAVEAARTEFSCEPGRISSIGVQTPVFGGAGSEQLQAALTAARTGFRNGSRRWSAKVDLAMVRPFGFARIGV